MQFDATRPIWLQLVEEFSRRIAVGEWSVGEKIPGVRELAADLEVNPNTVQRALAELENRGVCFSERTAGRFVTRDAERIRALREELASGATETFIGQIKGDGFDLDQALDIVHTYWTQKES